MNGGRLTQTSDSELVPKSDRSFTSCRIVGMLANAPMVVYIYDRTVRYAFTTPKTEQVFCAGHCVDADNEACRGTCR